MRRAAALLITVLLLTSAPRAADAQTAARSAGMLKVNDVRLYHEVRGSGPPLVLITGLGASLWLWEEQLPALAEHFTTIAFDNRGVGRSEAPEGPYTIVQMADDVAGLLDALGIERAHVLGFSMGGFVAQEFALRHPHRLVLAATGDLLVPVENARILAQRIPGSRLIVYEGFGHQFNVEAHERFNRDVVEFLRGPR
jgi:pimeloyl-ACP methyl ester carboxylesterase